MPFGDKNEKPEKLLTGKSSGSDENYQTEEDFSDESFSDSIKRFKQISIAKSHRSPKCKKNVKTRLCRLNVSLRNVKHNRHFKARGDARKSMKKKLIKNSSAEHKCLENPTEAPKNGQRYRLAGKAKGKLPEEENDKSDSDDDNDNYYFSRISLGHFQKFRDKSGASTSYEWHEECTNPVVCEPQELHNNLSEEMELLELQRWGRTNLVCNRKSEILEKAEKVHSDSL